MAQIPGAEEIPSNSQKSKQALMELPKQQEKPPVPQFGGVGGAKRKEQSKFWKWMRKMFLSDKNPKDIMKEILENQVIPGVKDNFRNSVVSGIDMFIYQGAKTANNNSSSNHVSYNSMWQRQQAQKSTVSSTAPSSSANNGSQADNNESNGFSNPTFKWKSNNDPNNIGAEQFLLAMKERDYPTLSVMDLYTMRGKQISWTWDVWGWTKEEIQNVQIVRINNPERPWMIDLPPAHLINN